MDESAARAQIVRYCTRLWDRHLVTGTSGNVSVKLDDGTVLVTPSQRALAELRAEEIVRVDASGKVLGEGRPSSELPLHVSAYAARHDIRCVVHTHPTFCVVWSRTGRLFPQDTVGAKETLGAVAWATYSEPGTRELADRCAAEFMRGIDVVVMERHGLTTLGRTLEDAFLLADLAEEAAKIGYYGEFTGA